MYESQIADLQNRENALHSEHMRLMKELCKPGLSKEKAQEIIQEMSEAQKLAAALQEERFRLIQQNLAEAQTLQRSEFKKAAKATEEAFAALFNFA